jgi:hypothetical protein
MFKRPRVLAACSLASFLFLHGFVPPANAAAPPQSSVARAIGTIKSISRSSLVLTLDSGAETSVNVDPNAKLLRVEPGAKDLKSAEPLALSDLRPGDRILVRGPLAPDGKTINALSVIAMMKLDIAQKQAHEREEWQKNGVGGIVKTLDPAAGTIVIATNSLGANKDLNIKVTPETILRRYAPNSVKFDDARPAPIGEIRPGDQLRARGQKNTQGTELAADEIVSGSFRNIAGTISAIDASAGTLTVHDLATKADDVVHIASDTQMRKLPEQMAEHIAMQLKGAAAGAAPPPGSPGGESHVRTGAGMAPRENGGARGADFQRILARMPAASLSDLQKGDAVMIVATEGQQGGAVTAITLLSGVEPILRASPKGNAGTILSPWSLNSQPAEAGGENPQ